MISDKQLEANRSNAKTDEAMNEAAALLQLNEMRDLEYFPEKAAQAQVRCAANSKQNGFVFSTAEIHTAIDRRFQQIQTPKIPNTSCLNGSLDMRIRT